MEWTKLLSGKKIGNVRSEVEEKSEGRSKFQRDYDRITFSTAFRRLQNKTQVIPLPWNDHIHNGLHPYDWTDKVRIVWRGNPLFS